jgi:NAD(P)-dependent dehydrogenase (short-subunit alcohol dehydrogenase family)
MDLGLVGKSALITGASKGIGLACTASLAAEGCNVHMAARSRPDLDAARAQIMASHGVQATVHVADLSLPESASELARQCGGIDILVNNAGAIPRRALLGIDDGAWRRAWDLKVYGFINLTREVYRAMRARGRGVIINIVGMTADAPNPNSIVASTGNAALVAFTRALGAESAECGIRVVAVSPGLVRTERTQALLEQAPGPDSEAWSSVVSRLPYGRMAESREVGDVVAFLASDRASYVNATVVTVDGGTTYRH